MREDFSRRQAREIVIPGSPAGPTDNIQRFVAENAVDDTRDHSPPGLLIDPGDRTRERLSIR